MKVQAIVGLGLALALAAPGTPFLSSTATAETPDVAVACAGIEAADRESSFTSWSGVSRATRLTRVEYVGKAPMHRTAGAHVFVPARAGLSDAYLERVVGCQLATGAASGGSDALSVAGIEASVRRVSGGYRVSLVSDDVGQAAELVRRLGL